MRLSRLLLLLIAPVVLLPSYALAEDHGTPMPQETPRSYSPAPQVSASPVPSTIPRFEENHAQFCTQIGTVTGPLGTDVLDRFGQLSQNFGSRNGDVTAQDNDLLQKLESQRSEANTNLQAAFTKLNAFATTDAQKAAVSAFEAAVTQAVTTRRAAVDAADQTFFAGIKAALADRQSELLAAATAYKQAVQQALAAAQASCTAGTTPTTVRSTLEQALQTAHTTLQNAINAAQKVGPNVQALQTTRDAAVTAANNTFKAAVQQALATLKAALGVTSSPSPSPSPSPTP